MQYGDTLEKPQSLAIYKSFHSEVEWDEIQGKDFLNYLELLMAALTGLKRLRERKSVG